MNAATKALESSKDLFPQLDHQRRVIAKSLKRQNVTNSDENLTANVGSNDNLNDHSGSEIVDKFSDEDSKLPKAYRRRPKNDASDLSSSSDELKNGSDDNVSRKSSSSSKRKTKKRGKKRKNSEASPPETTFNDEFSSLSDTNFDEFDEAKDSAAETAATVPLIEDQKAETDIKSEVTYENSVQVFKVEGTEDLSESDLESGELM